MSRINPNIEDSSKQVLYDEFNSNYFLELKSFLTEEKNNYTIFPPGSEIFAAFNYTSFNNARVIILGQDPYHGPKQANGLCFSVRHGIRKPPSLQNIFKELYNDLKYSIPESGNLENWAKQGVLLLNATLTVRANQAGSHQNKGWETFTDAAIKHISKEKEGVVFLLWGGFAKKKATLIASEKHHILTSGHPSPLSANRGYWFGNKHFSKTNELLQKIGKEPIAW